MQVAVRQLTSKGSKEAMVRSTMSTSSVNMRPAMGALKMPATAPEAPQPMSSMSILWSSLNMRPRWLPMAEPVSTMGDSAPTEPPQPMVSAEAMTLDQQLCDRICPPLRDRA